MRGTLLLFVLLLHKVLLAQSPVIETWLSLPEEKRGCIEEIEGSTMPRSHDEVMKMFSSFFKAYYSHAYAELSHEFEEKVMHFKETSMPFYVRSFGEKPAQGYSLYISLHGGGGCPSEVNDRQYENQKYLYQLKEGIYFVPRAPADTWDLWQRPYMEYYLDRIIQMGVTCLGVNPNKVYIMGYSAGGDGVYQMATRMADRWAAGAMMAGHPGDASPINLRNIGFTIHMGENDEAFDRNTHALVWGQKLDSLQLNSDGAYKHSVHLHNGVGHWMEGRDHLAIDWMSQFTRNPFPKYISWRQDDVLHHSFYWLTIPKTEAYEGGEIQAYVDKENNAVHIIECYTANLSIKLNDYMLDLDKNVKVYFKQAKVFDHKVERNYATLWNNLKERWDAGSFYPAKINISIKR